jgi:hypothetical protein
VGYAYPDGAPVVKVIVRGPTLTGTGTVGLSGRFRCIGAGCPSRRGLATVVRWNDYDTLLGWQAVQIDLPGAACTSLAYYPLWDTLPPFIGTTITFPYECVDVYGYLLGTGTVYVTRRR